MHGFAISNALTRDFSTKTVSPASTTSSSVFILCQGHAISMSKADIIRRVWNNWSKHTRLFVEVGDIHQSGESSNGGEDNL